MKCGPISSLLVVASVVGCTTLLGVDGEYYPEETARPAGSTGGQSGAGSSGAGGTSGRGGSGGSSMGGAGGQLGAAGADATTCPANQKLCTVETDGAAVTECFDPDSIVGCAGPSCDPCDAPPQNAVVLCKQGQCAFECIQGYMPLDGRCQPNGTGGSSGTGGAAGTSGTGGTGGVATCDPMACPRTRCGPAGPFPCCKADKTCGCTWAIGAVCY